MNLPKEIENFLTITGITLEFFFFFLLIYRCKIRRQPGLLPVFSVVAVIVFFILTLLLPVKATLVGYIPAYLCAFFIFSLSFPKSFRLFSISFFILTLFDSTQSFLYRTIVSLPSETTDPYVPFITVVLILIYYAVLGKRFKKDSFEIKDRIWLPYLLITIVITAAITNYQFLMGEIPVNNNMKIIGVILSGFGGFIIFILYFVLLYNINSMQDYQKKLTESVLFSDLQRKHFEELLLRDKITKKLRHDYNSDLVMLKAYLKQEEYKKATDYLDQICNSSIRIREKIYTVGNEEIDIVLNYYLAEIKKNTEIVITGNAGVCANVDDRDLTVIVSNLVKNAVDELNEADLQIRHFYFECTNDGNTLIIRTRNTFLCKNGDRQYQGSSFSKKGGNHLGIGLTNIEETVNKYNGVFFYRKTESVFETETRLPLS